MKLQIRIYFLRKKVRFHICKTFDMLTPFQRSFAGFLIKDLINDVKMWKAIYQARKSKKGLIIIPYWPIEGMQS